MTSSPILPESARPPTSRPSEPIDPSKSAFERLPDEIIQQILHSTDPSSFASLILLNSNWRRVSQQAHLYAHHLAQCPSYAASHKPFPTVVDESKLPELRRSFAKEIKRNLFQAYLRPNETVIKLISNSISSSSCPGGEGLQFIPSPRGRHLLAYNSSRIYVIDVTTPEFEVKRELKILRRPVSACIKDDGSVLAVLSTDMQVDLYDLGTSPPKRTKSVILDHSPRTISLSLCGKVLAAAYEGGIEVSSLSGGALATDKRAVKCDAVDALSFSFDGTQILGTTIHSNPPSTVILTAPYYEPGSHMPDESISALWTTSILFPNTSRDCSHAVLHQESSHEEAYWTITYDRSFESFRAVRIDDLRNGNTYFTGPAPTTNSPNKLLPCTLPATTFPGDMFSAGFHGKEIWVYGIPEDLDAVPESSVSAEGSPSGINRRSSGHSARPVSRIQDKSGPRPPQWQVLCDKLRNTFVTGSKVAELDGVSTVKWVGDFGSSPLKERLIVAARGVMPPKPISEEDDIDFVDGGRITLLDFDYSLRNGKRTEITIEVGTKEPEVLEEERRDMDTEVAIVRRRTVAQRRGGRSAALRATTRAATTATASAHSPIQPPQNENDDDDPLLPRRIGQLRPSAPTIQTITPDEDGEECASIEEQEAMDAPYTHAGPRSGTTLRRAATAAAVHRRLHPQPAGNGQYEYRRADGRREHPHESDADNWVPPPPPYQKDNPQDLPLFLRNAVIDERGRVLTQPTTGVPPQGLQSSGRSQGIPPQQNIGGAQQRGGSQPAPRQRTQPQVESPQLARATHHRQVSSDSTIPTSQPPAIDEIRRPTTSWTINTTDLYDDVSPPDSPHAPALSPVSTITAQPRRISSVPTSTVSPGSVQQQNNSRSPRISRLQPTMSSPIRADGAAPLLNLRIPSPTLNNFMWNGNGSSPQAAPAPSGRRLSNSSTWPRAPQPDASTSPATAGFPRSAPPVQPGMLPISVSAPRPDQLASLSHHQQQGSPRRVSAPNSIPRVPVGGRPRQGDVSMSPPQTHVLPQRQSFQQHREYLPHQEFQDGFHRQYQPSPQPRRNYPEPDQPLIVSTPAGVQGAFDPPDRRVSTRRPEMQVLAPIPRHPRAAPPPLRPTVERLESIYSRGESSNDAQPQHQHQHQHQHQQPPPQQQQRFGGLLGGSFLNVPPQLTPVSTSSGRHASVKRRKSRARQSAQRNVADARKKGLLLSGGGGKKKKKSKKPRDFDVASSAAWTDISGRSDAGGDMGRVRGDKDGKCVVM